MADDEENIKETATRLVKIVSSIKKAHANLQNIIATLGAERDKVSIDYHIAVLSARILWVYIGCEKAFSAEQDYDLYEEITADKCAKESGDELADLLNDDEAKKKINLYLNSFGLNLSQYRWCQSAPDIFVEEFDIVKNQDIESE